MHEFSLADQVVKTIEAVAEKHHATSVRRVLLRLGRYSVDKQSLSFCLQAISEGTLLAGAEFELSDLEQNLRCDNCGAEINEVEINCICPTCGVPTRSYFSSDILIQEIELNEPDGHN